MNPLTVIIPSRNAENLVPCVDAVRRNEPGARVVVVDDGLDLTDAEYWAEELSLEVVLGEKPFVFARNVNLGIFAAAEKLDVTTHSSGGPEVINGRYSDVVLLNDDAILETPGGFTSMQAAAAEVPKIAIVSAVTNIASNPAQTTSYPGWEAVQKHIREGGAYGDRGHMIRTAGNAPGLRFPSVAFVCVFIPARTLETIGLLDERYTAYGWEDVDYCRRIHEAGQLIGIDDRCFVDHSKLTSTFRGDPRAPGPIDEGRAIYFGKWGKA